MNEEERPDQPRRSGLLRRLRRAALVLLGLLLAVAVGLHLPPVQRALGDYGLGRLRSAIHADVSWRGIQFNLLTRTATVTGFSLGAPGVPPFITADRVYVVYRWGTYKGSLDGLDVTLENAQVTLLQQNKQWTTIPAGWLAPSKTPSQPRPLPAFAAIRLHNVNVRYEDVDAKFIADTHGLTADLLPDGSGAPGALAGAISAGATSAVSWYPRVTQLTVLGGRGRYSPQGAGVDALKMELAEGVISTDVHFAFHGNDRLKLTAGATFKGEAIKTWLPFLDTLKGPLGVTFTMPASGGAPAFADVALHGVNISWRDVPIDDMTAQGALETGGITLTDTVVRVGRGIAQGKGRLAWEDAGQSRATLTLRDFDAGDLWKRLLASSPGALYVTPGSLVSGTFTGDWNGWHAASLQGRLQSTWRARPGGLVKGEQLWLDGSVDAHFDRGPWRIAVDARADGALDMKGDVVTRGSEKNYSDWPLSGRIALSGETAPVVLDGFRLLDVDWGEPLKSASGALKGEAELSRTFSTARAALTIGASVGWPDQPRVDVDLSATVDPDALVVSRMEAHSGPAAAAATAQLDFNHKTIQASATARSVAVEAWARRYGLNLPVTGLTDLAGQISGTFTRPQVDAEFRGGPVQAFSQAFDSVRGQVQLVDGVLRVTEVHAAARTGGEIAGAVTWTLKTGAIDATALAQALHLTTDVPAALPVLPATITVTLPQATSPTGVSAIIDGTVRATGTTDALSIDGDLQTPALMFGGKAVGPVSATVRTESGTAQLHAKAPDLGATIDGTLGLTGDRPFTAALEVHSPDSPVSIQLGRATLEIGATDFDAHVTGSATAGRVATAEVCVDRLEGAYGSLPLMFKPGAQVTWAPGTLHVTDVEVTTGQSRIAGNGTLDGTVRQPLIMSLQGRLEDFRPLAAQLVPANADTLVLTGPFSGTVTATGALDQPDVTGSLRLDGAELGDGRLPPFTDVNLRASLDSRQLHIELAEVHWQGAHAAVAGTVPAWFLGVPGAPHGDAAKLTGHVDDVTVQVLQPFLSPDALKARDFKARAEYTVTAAKPTLDAVVADVHLTDALISSGDLGLAQQRPGHLTLANGVATLEPWTIVARASADTRVTLGGSVQLLGTQTVNAKLDGNLDLRSLGLLLGSYRPAGTATVSATIRGPLMQPDIDGEATLRNGELVIRDPRLLFSGINGTAQFKGGQLVLRDVRGAVNGGSLEAGGAMALPGRPAIPGGGITIAVRGALFDVPKGFRSLVDADLKLAGRQQDSRLTLSGTATIVDAAYRQSLIVTGGILSLFQDKEQPVVVPNARRSQGPPLLTLDLRILADDSIAIDTSYGKVAVGGNLRVFGPPANVRILGQADIAPGGQLYFGGHTYQIESARVEFRDPTTIKPDVHMVATTRIGGYDLTMRVDTVEGRTETTLSSDPPLPEDQIASLMVSGQTTSSASAGDVVTQQLAAALSGEITSAIGRAIGFDSVRLESGNPGDVMFDPTLVSAESNPAQRLTFSKRVFPTLEVIVSQNLRESGQVTWIVAYEPTPRFELRVVQLDNQDRSYEVRHDVSFGGGAPTRAAKKRIPERVRDVFIAVFGDITQDDVRKALRVTEGRKFDFFKWQEDRDSLEKLFLERGYYAASLIARRDPPTPPLNATESTPVDLGYTIQSGPHTELVINGIKVPDSLRKRLIAAWIETPVPALLNDAFSDQLTPWLASEGYLRGEVETHVETTPGPRRGRNQDDTGAKQIATVTITPGPRSTTRVVVFAGNTHVTSKDLDKAVVASGLGDRVWHSPEDLKAVITSAYHDRGYLAAEITVAPPRFADPRAELPVSINEGAQYHVGTATIDDPIKVAAKGIDATPPLLPGALLTDDTVAEAVRALQQQYRRAGFRRTRITAQSNPRTDKTTVDVTFHVVRGEQPTLGTLTVAGVEGSERDLIEHLVDFTPGEPVSLDALNTARDRLYDTDLFRTVTVDATPRPAATGQAPTGLVDATVTVELLPKYRLQYGFQLFDPYRPAVDPRWGSVDPGVVADLTRRGLFGRGMTAGISGRLNPSDRVARAYLSSRRFWGRPLQTNFYIGDELENYVSGEAFIKQRTRDITLEQRLRRRAFQLSYGYNFERLNIKYLETPTGQLPLEDVNASISRLIGSLYIDRRDNAIDTSKGWFHSTSAEFGPEWLGSTAGLRKYLFQNFYFLPVGPFVFGSAARYEIASGPGQRFIITERLRAGGSTTVRGYDDLVLAVLAAAEDFSGRTSLLVLNEEMRFPLFRRFRGATFWDHASFFGDLATSNNLQDRNSVGAGVRFVLPFLLLRVDYGYPLNQDPFNNKGRWYFAIGQAF